MIEEPEIGESKFNLRKMDRITKAIKDSRDERAEHLINSLKPLYKTDKKHTDNELYKEKLYSLFWGIGMGLFIGVMIGLMI